MAIKQGNKNADASDGLMSRIHRVWGAGPLHQAKLKGPTPDRLYFQPHYPLSSDRELGLNIMRGRMSVGGEIIDFRSQGNNADRNQQSVQEYPIQEYRNYQASLLWRQLSKNNISDADLQSPDVNNAHMGGTNVTSRGALFRFAHEFSWLHHMVALNGENIIGDLGDDNLSSPTQVTKDLLEGWLDHFEQWSPESWAPDLVAERLMHMCAQSDFILKSGDALWRSRVLNSMARQTRHLAHIAHKAPAGTNMLMTAIGLCLAGLCIPFCEVAIERGQELMRRELRLQVRSDGGHVSRNPSLQLELVVRLQMIVSVYGARKLAMPGYLKLALTRASAMAQFFRCPDGRLAIFNGGYEADPRMLIMAGQVIEQDTTPMGFARYSYYQRMSAARGLVIADVGGRAEQTQTGFDSAGSFHFSSGRVRIIGNCGNGDHLGVEWLRALRQASAHSTLSFETTHRVSNRSRASLFSGYTRHQRDEEMSGILLEIRRAFALAHQDENYYEPSDQRSGKAQLMGDIEPGWAGHARRLFVTAGGDDFRGEDAILGLPALYRPYWRLRFHLHPEVKASLARDGRSVILILPNQEGWRFRTNFQGVRLEKSIYCGAGGRPVTTEQIVLGPVEGGDNQDDNPHYERDILLKWAFKRLDGI